MIIKAYYFSPTGGIREVMRHLAVRLGTLTSATVEYHSYTLTEERKELPALEVDDIILWATPVYAGRIPNKTLDYVRQALTANTNGRPTERPRCKSIALVTFGNRA